MLYPLNKVNYIIIQKGDYFLWDTQKNIEDEEKWAQKKEELEKETKKDNILSGKYKQN